MTTIILSGANGKMGQVISRLASDMDSIKIVAGKDINTEQHFDFPVYDNWESMPKADAIIDFSHPSGLESLLAYATSTNTPAVIATTGLSDSQKEQLKDAAKKTAIFFSANMSLGINLLIDLVKKATKILSKNFDIEIVERHHNQKIDAPSGTALAIADAIAEEIDTPTEFVYDRHSVRKKRAKTEIGISSVRGGTIVGDHEVIFAGNDEIIEIKHHAASKEIFAVGAIRAGEYLAGKPAGMYDMQDLVKSQQ